MRFTIAVAVLILGGIACHEPRGTPEQRERASKALENYRELAEQLPIESARLKQVTLDMKLAAGDSIPAARMAGDYAASRMGRLIELLPKAHVAYIEACSQCAPVKECEESIADFDRLPKRTACD